jgi:hypothetical protein
LFFYGLGKVFPDTDPNNEINAKLDQIIDQLNQVQATLNVVSQQLDGLRDQLTALSAQLAQTGADLIVSKITNLKTKLDVVTHAASAWLADPTNKTSEGQYATVLADFVTTATTIDISGLAQTLSDEVFGNGGAISISNVLNAQAVRDDFLTPKESFGMATLYHHYENAQILAVLLTDAYYDAKDAVTNRDNAAQIAAGTRLPSDSTLSQKSLQGSLDALLAEQRQRAPQQLPASNVIQVSTSHLWWYDDSPAVNYQYPAERNSTHPFPATEFLHWEKGINEAFPADGFWSAEMRTSDNPFRLASESEILSLVAQKPDGQNGSEFLAPLGMKFSYSPDENPWWLGPQRVDRQNGAEDHQFFWADGQTDHKTTDPQCKEQDRWVVSLWNGQRSEMPMKWIYADPMAPSAPVDVPGHPSSFRDGYYVFCKAKYLAVRQLGPNLTTAVITITGPDGQQVPFFGDTDPATDAVIVHNADPNGAQKSFLFT